MTGATNMYYSNVLEIAKKLIKQFEHNSEQLNYDLDNGGFVKIIAVSKEHGIPTIEDFKIIDMLISKLKKDMVAYDSGTSTELPAQWYAETSEDILRFLGKDADKENMLWLERAIKKAAYTTIKWRFLYKADMFISGSERLLSNIKRISSADKPTVYTIGIPHGIYNEIVLKESLVGVFS